MLQALAVSRVVCGGFVDCGGVAVCEGVMCCKGFVLCRGLTCHEPCLKLLH
jgi:hypothetical protein